jgi:hypothetical protein
MPKAIFIILLWDNDNIIVYAFMSVGVLDIIEIINETDGVYMSSLVHSIDTELLKEIASLSITKFHHV